MILTIGTRKSNLALWQTEHVAQLIREQFPHITVEIEHFVTQGDRTLDKPLPEIGGKGLFTWELERSLREREIDLAVHSLKDLPVEDAEGLTVGAIIGRADPRDALVAQNGWTMETLPLGAIVGTSSLRRQAQLLRVRPDLHVKSIRGNVETRIRKALDENGAYHATILAKAGLDRLGLAGHITEILPVDVMLPAPGQGALGVQCRANDDEILTVLRALDCGDVRRCVTAERHFLHALNAGCSAPVGAYATIENNDEINLRTYVDTSWTNPSQESASS